MKNGRATGYVCISFGIGLIFLATAQLYLIFTNKIEPFPLFATQTPSQNITPLVPTPSPNIPTSQSILISPSPQTVNSTIELAPPNTANQLLNFGIHFSLLVLLLAFGMGMLWWGARMLHIARIGKKMVP